MEEILAISDEVTIMRDGQWIVTEAAKDLTMERIIQLMVGRYRAIVSPRNNHPGL